MRTRSPYDVVALLARLGVGVIFIAHGWQKIQVGVTSTGHTFKGQGVPLPTVAAVYSTFVELLGGAALILGLGLPVAGLLLFVDMAGAVAFVNGKHGLFITGHRDGYELVLALGLASLLFATGAGGRFSLDARLFRRRDPSPRATPTSVAPPEVEPRLASEIVEDISRDTLVAGSKAAGSKPAGSKRPAAEDR
ncbi:MAG: DoxX family protein [Actinomycetia bacterium]|nr:DoxX family protein [Actinomycetes bacterium]